MKQATNCILIAPDGKILLSMKKRGFGFGKWNGAGGKVHEGETVIETAIREIKEEIGVSVEESDLVKVAEIEYANDDPDWGSFVHVFITRKWQGEPSESEEMRPKWFGVNEIPYSQAWDDLVVWLPRVLNGEKLKGTFIYKSDGEHLDHFEVAEVAGF